MIHPLEYVLQVIILVAVIGIIVITLALNTKSEGLGAAITGASDTYRGAVGVEEQKRRLLSSLCWVFIALSFVVAIVHNYL